MEVKYERATILIKRGILKGKANLYLVATSPLPPPPLRAKYSIFSCNFGSCTCPS